MFKHNIAKSHALSPFSNKKYFKFHGDLAAWSRLRPLAFENHNMFICSPWLHYSHANGEGELNLVLKVMTKIGPSVQEMLTILHS